ncbi:flavodoxin domain-containing protein [Haloimpatiens sp. FM7315]|uniref:flavodoxin domain-containing protein n=1 Tax=Haloimpatiens sp. FM7315 TaxID=3298609 RepID=UPI0035A39C70
MKTLMVYATNHGCVEKCTNELKKRLKGEVVNLDIKKESIKDLSEFDKVIIGGSIYVGKIQKQLSKFCLNRFDELKEKEIGIFICGLRDGDEGKAQIKTAFRSELYKKAKVKGYFGGNIIFNKLNFFEKLIIKAICKENKDINNIIIKNIDEFAENMNKIN